MADMMVDGYTDAPPVEPGWYALLIRRGEGEDWVTVGRWSGEAWMEPKTFPASNVACRSIAAFGTANDAHNYADDNDPEGSTYWNGLADRDG